MANEDRFAEFRAKENGNSHIKNVIAVCSGKGGVGKSLVTSLLAVNARREGYKVGILDGDITGPSIPTIFGLEGPAYGSETEIYPVDSKSGIKAISVNLLDIDKSAPVVWRGPVIAGMIKQFYSDVCWGDLDFLFVDMPPGTSDVPLTVFQSLPVKAIIAVTSPQDLVSLIVEKAVKMAQMMDVPLLGLVENMSYLECPDCGKKIHPFGEPHSEIAEKYGIPFYEQLPIDPKLREACDQGKIEEYPKTYLDKISKALGRIK
ncbi:MAG: Mrp/NBP35 family ATP-binding protein [Bacillota bacterium]|nr:Mrp/NBP35 family ATP-binding protein [Bacillota bacterium]